MLLVSKQLVSGDKSSFISDRCVVYPPEDPSDSLESFSERFCDILFPHGSGNGAEVEPERSSSAVRNGRDASASNCRLVSPVRLDFV